jgi:hypothetical protein
MVDTNTQVREYLERFFFDEIDSYCRTIVEQADETEFMLIFDDILVDALDYENIETMDVTQFDSEEEELDNEIQTCYTGLLEVTIEVSGLCYYDRNWHHVGTGEMYAVIAFSFQVYHDEGHNLELEYAY